MLVQSLLGLGLLLTGAILGRVFFEYYYSRKAWQYYDVAQSYLEVIREFREAATPIVIELEIVGDKTDWRDGPETDRVYPWYEIEPLKKMLDRTQCFAEEGQE